MKKPDSSLKILHILDHSIPLHSGYAFRTQNIFRAEQEKGWAPIGLTTLKHEIDCPGDHVDKEYVEGLCFYRSPFTSPSRGWFGTQALLMKMLARRIQEVIELEAPDLLHVHSPVLNALPALWVARAHNIPVVYEIRAFWEDAAVDHDTYEEGSWKYRVVRTMETFACQRSSHVTVLCDGIKNDLIGRGISPNKLTVIPNGINLEDFKDCRANEELRSAWDLEGKRVIGFIGSFYRYEGLDLLVSAVPSLVKRHKDLVLLLVGGGEVKKELEQQVQALGIESHVRMPGRIDHDLIPGVYGLVDIFVYPRVSIRLTELVTPLKPLEAMVVGKPLVASDIGGHRELIQEGETGVLFTPGKVEALSSVLERLLKDQDRTNQIAQQGQDWVKAARSWEETTSGYEQVYECALDR